MLRFISTSKTPDKIRDILFDWEKIIQEDTNPKFLPSLSECLLRAAVVSLYYIVKNKYQSIMQDTLNKCKEIIKHRNRLWIFRHNLRIKHKCFLMALLLFWDKIIFS